MKILGIDYGKKRVGVALSDESGHFAFPHSVIQNKGVGKVTNEIKKICKTHNVAKIILGKSINLDGKPNFIMFDIEKLKTKLETNFKVVYEDEAFTTKEALRPHQKENLRSGFRRLFLPKHKLIDASSASLILRSYLNRQKMLK